MTTNYTPHLSLTPTAVRSALVLVMLGAIVLGVGLIAHILLNQFVFVNGQTEEELLEQEDLEIEKEIEEATTMEELQKIEEKLDREANEGILYELDRCYPPDEQQIKSKQSNYTLELCDELITIRKNYCDRTNQPELGIESPSACKDKRLAEYLKARQPAVILPSSTAEQAVEDFNAAAKNWNKTVSDVLNACLPFEKLTTEGFRTYCDGQLTELKVFCEEGRGTEQSMIKATAMCDDPRLTEYLKKTR
jgi:hypothetical protein